MKTKFIQTTFQLRGINLLLITIFTSFSVFSQTPPNEQNALNATGNVGVGTISPDSKLQVNGSMSIDSSLTVRDTAIFEKQARMKDKIIVEGDAVIKGKLTARDNFKVLGTTKIEGPLKLTNLPNAQADDTTFLFVNANGKVKAAGIPALLNILSANPQAINTLQNIIYGTLSNQVQCRTNPTFLVAGDGSFYFYNGTKKTLQMDNEGVIKSREIYIDTQNWPDFVFEKEYKLPTLAETERYIELNGHLPGVPSAEQIESEGLNVAATNTMLMQKVEELTLHLIAQEKIMQQQAEQLQGLQQAIDKLSK